MKIKYCLAFAALFVLSVASYAQTRKIIGIPDIDGYVTLKCDFHMHTVFSDGTVWPTVRVQEAWEEGLDAISITDHIEYRPHSKDVISDHNRSFEIAKPLAKSMDIILVKGTEITRRMPPGHLNALFIKDANLIDHPDLDSALIQAGKQGAFILWNHPCWDAQQPDTVLWWEKHTELFEKNLMQGIEVYNGEFCVEALEWANEKNLTMFGNSDVHGPMKVDEGHRTLTLVFAKERSEEAIKEALQNRRTLVYFDNTLVGKEEYLKQVFFKSLQFKEGTTKHENRSKKVVLIVNSSDVDFEMELLEPGIGFKAPENITLKAHAETALVLEGNSDEITKMNSVEMKYSIKNLVVGSTENLVVGFKFSN